MTFIIQKSLGFSKREILGYKTFMFPGGEVGVKLDAHNLRYLSTKTDYQTITARLQNPVDVLNLIMLVDALKRFDPTPIRLFMPYVPYARQDRVCVAGEPFSLKAFANIINSLGFEKIAVVDPHSDVTGAVFNNLEVITQVNIIDKWDKFRKDILSSAILVSPDAGANKKISALAGYLGHYDFIRADKKRNLETGAIIETIVYAENINRPVVIVDDICDGGKTFIELAKVLKAKGATKVILYVTHGIFSKGVKVLLDGGIDDIWITNSYSTGTDNMNAFNLEEYFVL